jgi:hypothetical protein
MITKPKLSYARVSYQRLNKATPINYRASRAVDTSNLIELEYALLQLDSLLTPENASFGGNLRQTIKRRITALGGSV